MLARKVREFFAEARNRQAVADFLAAGVKVLPAGKVQGPLAGRRFVFTGALEQLTREEARREVDALGGRVGDSVGRGLDFVVVGADPGRKLERARRLGVPILAEAEFAAMLRRARRG